MTANILTNIIAFILVLGFLIFAHEAGHFFVAKMFRVRVLVFSFGFGKRLFGFRRGDTDYRVSAIPLGGYVRLLGEEDPTDPRSLAALAAWKRLVVMGAGAFMKTLERARALCAAIQAIGAAAGKRVTCVLTDMDAPIGRTIGNALEVRESIEILRGGGPADTRELTITLGSKA